MAGGGGGPMKFSPAKLLDWLVFGAQVPGEYDSEVLQALVDRMARAGWIEGAIVTPDPVDIEFTALGRARLSALQQILRNRCPALFDGRAKRIGRFGFLRAMSEIYLATAELLPPRLTKREEITLLAFVLGKSKSGDSPGNRLGLIWPGLPPQDDSQSSNRRGGGRP
jgi:hypothetical protein